MEEDVIGPILIASAFIAVIIGAFGKEKKIGFWGAFLLSFFFTPLVGILVVIFSKSKAEMEREARSYKIQQAQREAIGRMEARQATSNMVDELAKLQTLLEKGAITREEFDSMKASVMKRTSEFDEWNEWYNKD